MNQHHDDNMAIVAAILAIALLVSNIAWATALYYVVKTVT